MSVQSRRWAFTDFDVENWYIAQDDAWKGPAYGLVDNFEYLVAGYEVCPTTNKPHIQGYVFLRRKITLSGLRTKMFASRPCHFEIAYGDHHQNRTYCIKGGKFREWGKFEEGSEEGSSKKQKHDWAAIKASAKAGDLEAVPPGVFVNSYKTLKLIAADHKPKPPDLTGPCGIWLYGKAGNGKSYHARYKLAPTIGNGRVFEKDAATKWWCGYDGEDNVLLDDVDPSHRGVLSYYLKIWADAYAFKAENKGGGTGYIRPKKVIVTSQYHLADIFEDRRTYDAMRRRFQEQTIEKWDGQQGTQNPGVGPGNGGGGSGGSGPSPLILDDFQQDFWNYLDQVEEEHYVPQYFTQPLEPQEHP